MSGSVCSIEHQDLSIYSQILSLLIYHSVTFSYIYIVIVSGYSYYVHMLVTQLKSDMCLVFFCTINTFTLQLICHYLTSFSYGPPS